MGRILFLSWFISVSTLFSQSIFQSKFLQPNLTNESIISSWSIEVWDSTDWKNLLHYQNFYNTSSLLSEIHASVWDEINFVWKQNSRNFLFYDSENRLQQYLTEVWRNGTYKNYHKQTYEYTNFDSISIFQSFLWNDTINSWNNYSKTVNEYDSNNYLLEKLYYEGSDSGWDAYSRSTFNYDSSYFLTTELSQIWQGQWENVNRTLYYYSNSKLSQFIWQQWINSNWDSDHRESFTYDAHNNLIERLNESASGGGWINNFRDDRSYNQLNKLYSILTYYWVNNSWVKDRSVDYNYDTFGNLTEYIIKHWFDNDTWEYQWRIRYNYTITDNFEENLDVKEFSLFDAYPNPFNPITSIVYSLPNTEYVSIIIFDAIGKKVATLVDEVKSIGIHELKFNGVNLPSGIYYYRLQTEHFMQTKKIVLIK